MDRLDIITLKPSCISLRLHLGILLLALASVLLCGLSWLIKIPLVLCFSGRLFPVRNHFRVVKMGFEQGHWWAIVDNGEMIGNKMKIQLIGEQLVLPWLVVMNIRVEDSRQKHSFVLWRDTADKDDLRRLRVFLRYHRYAING